jgi:hypothetical protein
MKIFTNNLIMEEFLSFMLYNGQNPTKENVLLLKDFSAFCRTLSLSFVKIEFGASNDEIYEDLSEKVENFKLKEGSLDFDNVTGSENEIDIEGKEIPSHHIKKGVNYIG